MNLLPLVLLSLLPAGGGTPVNTTCNADLVCVKTYKASRVRLMLESYSHKPLSVQLYFTTPNLKHLRPAAVQLDRPAVVPLIEFDQPAGAWGYEYRTHYGHATFTHDDDHVYELPFTVGRSFRVAQAHDLLATHRMGNRFAIDWAMPIGEAVLAARAGRVVSTFDRSNGPQTGNHIWIQHSDGTIGKYLHLAYQGVHVQEGALVDSGTIIGTSGDTGFSRGPHLHFSVSTLGGDYLYQTFNVRFRTSRGVMQLSGGETYTRPK